MCIWDLVLICWKIWSPEPENCQNRNLHTSKIGKLHPLCLTNNRHRSHHISEPHAKFRENWSRIVDVIARQPVCSQTDRWKKTDYWVYPMHCIDRDTYNWTVAFEVITELLAEECNWSIVFTVCNWVWYWCVNVVFISCTMIMNWRQKPSCRLSALVTLSVSTALWYQWYWLRLLWLICYGTIPTRSVLFCSSNAVQADLENLESQGIAKWSGESPGKL